MTGPGAEPWMLVLFGASGDLTKRIVMPAIFRLARRGPLSPELRVIGFARTAMTATRSAHAQRGARDDSPTGLSDAERPRQAP